MSKGTYSTLSRIVTKIKDDFKSGNSNFVLLYAFNRTGKTRLSMEFKEQSKKRIQRDTLYFNAFTEDLFYWDNDLELDTNRVLYFNEKSHFFEGFKEFALEEKINTYLQRYVEFDFKIDYNAWKITFSKMVENPKHKRNKQEPEFIKQDNIKISRGEENIFIWCIFLAIVQLVLDGNETYSWVKYFYIDDPISSLDDNNTIAIACDLTHLLNSSEEKISTIISSHHGLFFNVLSNELKKYKTKQYYFSYDKDLKKYALQTTNDNPFFNHIAIIDELQKASRSNKLYTYHFNMLRNVLEKTSAFFGFNDFTDCIIDIDDKDLYARAMNLLSHGGYSVFEPIEMVNDNKLLFKEILNRFLNKYKFNLSSLN